MQKIWQLTKDTCVQFVDNGGSLLGAALAFYVLLSVAPLLLVIISGAGLVFGTQMVRGELTRQLTQYIGPNVAKTLTSLMESFHNTQVGTKATILGIIVLLWSASRMFSQLQSALNQLWHVRTEFKVAKVNILVTLSKYALAVGLVLLAGGFVTAFILFSTIATVAKIYFGDILPGGQAWVWQIVTLGLSVLLWCCFFTIIFRYLADATVAWRDAWVGASVTAVLCAISEYPLNYYLSHPGVESGYGAAGSLVVLLLWVYYTAQVFFLGAQFTAVYAHTCGRGVTPDATATLVRDAPIPQSAAEPAP